MEREDFIHDVVQAAYDVQSRELWKRFANCDCFGVQIEGQDESLLATVLGDAGEEYGLVLFLGSDAASSLATLLGADDQGDDDLADMHMLSFSMEAFGDLPQDAQAFMRKAGLRPRDDEQVPVFLTKAPGHQGRLPNDHELTVLLTTLRGVVEADKNNLLQPATLEDEEGICVINISDDAKVSPVTVTRERLEQETAPTTIPLIHTTNDLTDLPRLKATWLVGMPVVPAAIKDDDRAMQLLLIVDDTSELIIQGKPMFAGEVREAADTLVKAFQGEGLQSVKGLPRKIVFSSRKLCRAMGPVLEPLKVKCTYTPTIPKLRKITEEFSRVADSGFVPSDEAVESRRIPVTQVPLSDDLDGWKEVDKQLFNRFADHFEQEERLWSSRPVKRYFGDEDLEYYIQEHQERGVIAAYTAWGILDYRPTKRSKTHAEKMLEKGLPEPEAILLRARMKSLPTLYRVASHNPKAGTLYLDDVLLGGAVTVHDRLMSENIQDNLFLVARTFGAGCFILIEMAGPPLGAGMGKDAIDFLRYCGMKFTPEGQIEDAHLFGRLWRWISQWEANWVPPRLCNTDGEELLWHTGSFSITDPDRSRQILMQREDIDYDEQEDELVWSKEANNRAVGEAVTLGRIEIIGDELVLTANSANRFKTGRQWLEKLPGVAFKGVHTRRLDEADKDRPLDERISGPKPVEMTPELTDSLQEMMDKHFMGWLDTPIPALNNKTPRQAVKTKAGRQEVVMLIRTMPDPTGPAPIQVPRNAMLAELGLAQESFSPPSGRLETPHPPVPIEEIPSRPKVGRNAPCPCGSGRKYKKCCALT